MRRSTTLVATFLVASVATWFGVRQPWKQANPPAGESAPHPAESSTGGAEGRSPDTAKWGDRLSGHVLQLPTGVPARLSCRDVRRVVGQVRLHLASEPARVDPRLLADATIDWLDPHGLWSASPDAPLSTFLRKHERAFLGEIEAVIEGGPCQVASAAGDLMRGWMDTLSASFDEEFRIAEPKPVEEAFRAVTEPAFEDHAGVRPARQLAGELGRTLGVASR